MPIRAQISMDDEIIVDNFAGGGGTSTGLELATGRAVYAAINHDIEAIYLHKTNHPWTKHYCEDVWQIDPNVVCNGHPVGLAWFSPNCKHFSKAKGGKPVDRNIRGLAWVALRWAGMVQPRVIILENVEEFVTWGPVRRGKPIKSKQGQTFQRFVTQLRALGYTVDWRELVAADYGAPTTRKRFFLIARRDGRPIVWPEPTHAPADSEAVKSGRLKPWRSAAEIIDWDRPCPSIFESKEEIRRKYNLKVQRPLQPNTMARVARGIDKYDIKGDKPFFAPLPTKMRARSYGEAPEGNGLREAQVNGAFTEPFIAQVNHAGAFRGQTLDEPMPTITAKHGFGVVTPLMSPITFSNTSFSVGSPANGPVHTITTAGNQVLSVPRFDLFDMDAEVMKELSLACIAKYYGADKHGQNVDEPLHTVVSHDRYALLNAKLSQLDAPEKLNMASMVKLKGTNIGNSAEEPLQTITAGGLHHGVVCVMLAKVEPGADLQYWPKIREMLNTYCGYHLKDNQILLFFINGAFYFMSDIGLRMLTPRELYRANGFPEDYIIEQDYKGNVYKRGEQVKRCGNAVPPPFAYALARANFPEWCDHADIHTMAEFHAAVAV